MSFVGLLRDIFLENRKGYISNSATGITEEKRLVHLDGRASATTQPQCVQNKINPKRGEH